MKRSGFTMIELIFVIVILGILAAVAIPKLTATRDDAKIAKVQSDASTVITDLGNYYTSKGSFTGATAATVTNVMFGTAAAPTDKTGNIVGTPWTITDGTTTCLTIAVTAEGNVTVTPAELTASVICGEVVKGAVKSGIVGGTITAPAAKTVTLGGSNIVL
ncbi:MAG: prepilin-type N-terminal cleavage/methylation domain-containing protein [Sulfuricurvum sp.]|nr:prepilin-type N-terminal cleavage/methylation domain-containing protein [Sulfuricurvum sp.]MDP3023247.1 prepilin-type N-terminal cleavage/methylation domain-containing protein [Sulfuricurvum sp.]